MRNENLHRVVVCNRSAQRLAVLDVETKPTDNWVEHCSVVFGKWMLDNPGHEMLQSHVANGAMTVWVKQPN